MGLRTVRGLGECEISTAINIMVTLIMIRTVRGLGEREMQSRLISATIVPLRFCNISDVSYKL